MLTTSPSWALTCPPVLNDEMSQTALGPNTKKVTILIHGWQPCGGGGNAYTSGALSNLSQQLKSSFHGTEWQLVHYRWEQDADTTDPSLCNGILNLGALDFPTASVAADNAIHHGTNIANLIIKQCPDVRQIHFIAHSAGIWAAYSAATNILQALPFVTIQITLLDGFVPGDVSGSPLTSTLINNLTTLPGNDRIFRLESYHGDWVSDIAGIVTDNLFNWRAGRDIELTVSFNSDILVNPNPFHEDCYTEDQGHGGPIYFYTDTISSISSAPTYCLINTAGPFSDSNFDFHNFGWYKSLFYLNPQLPYISAQPQSQPVSSGAVVNLQCIASSSQALSYQWFLNGQRINGANGALYSFSANSTTTGDYVVEISNQNGFVFSDKATISLSAPTAPSIISVSPSLLTGLPLPQTQRLQIIGSAFTSSSTLVFDDGVNSYNSNPARLTFVNANEIDYLIAVGVNPATWTVEVVDGSQMSHLGTFSVASPSSAISLSCYVSPSTVSPNAAVTVSGTATYNNSGGNVVAGTVTITIGDQTYTAAITAGSYSRQITAPSSGGTYTVSVTVADGSGLTGSNTASLVVNSNGSASGYTINDFLTCSNADSVYPYDAYGIIDGFGSVAPQVITWLELGGITGTHSVELRMYQPNGSYTGNATGTIGTSGYTYDWWRTWWQWSMNQFEYTPGLWNIQLYIDGNYQQSISFTMRYQLTEHLMAKGVQSTTPFDPIQPSNIFYQTDAEALTWLNLNKVSDAINVKWIFYEPNGSKYVETIYSSPSFSTSGYGYWDWYKYWGSIYIAGNSAANKCGNWKVDVMIQDPANNWVKQYTDYFQLIESPPQPPVCSVTLTPTNTPAGQALTLTTSATDYTYLQSLVLYWNDGALHSHPWSNIFSNTFSQSQSIGTYSIGQQIQYWAVAADTSGNTTESIHKISVIPDTSPPKLSITSPANFTTSTNASLSVSGTATDGGNGNNGISLVTVDGIAANGGTASGSGTANWNAMITLNPGANVVAVIAYDAAGNAAYASITANLFSGTGITNNILFTESGNGSSIDTNKWTTTGNTVVESGGMMQVLTTVTDGGGLLTSVPIPINSTGDITITRNVLAHYANANYVGDICMKFGPTPWAAVFYANATYSGTGDEPRYGTYIGRNTDIPAGAHFNCIEIGHEIDTSEAFPVLWDIWFSEKIIYSPSTGYLQYFVNSQQLTNYLIAIMPPTNNPTLQLGFRAWGWGTGHEELFSNLVVSQEVSVPAPPNQLTVIGVSTNGMFLFKLGGPVGSNYVIQLSSDLVNWFNLVTNTIPAAGVRVFDFPVQTNPPTMFYRALPLAQGPLVLQPGPIDGQAIWTTSIYSNGTNTNGANGIADEDFLAGGWGDLYYAYLQFDLTGLPAHASSATVQLYSFAGWHGGAVTVSMYLDLVTQDWDGTFATGIMKWADKPTSTNLRTIAAPGIGTWYSFDVTDLYNAWQAGIYPNYGMALRPTGNSDQFNYFWTGRYLVDPTLRPKLVIVP